MNKLVILSICAVLSANCSDGASSSNSVGSPEDLRQRLFNSTANVDVSGFFQAVQDGADINRALVFLDGSADSALEVLIRNSCAGDMRKKKKPISDILVLLDYLLPRTDEHLLTLKLKMQMHGLGLLESVLDQGDLFLGNEVKIAKIYAMIAQRHLELGVKPKFSGLLNKHYALINKIKVDVNGEFMSISELVEKLKAMPEQSKIRLFMKNLFRVFRSK